MDKNIEMTTELNMDETSNLHENIVSFLQNNILNLKKQLESSPENVLSFVKRKIDEEVKEEEEEFRYKTTVLNLIQIYEYILMENYNEALAIIKALETEIDALNEKECGDKLYQRISVALKYLISSFKYYAILNKGDEENTNEILKSMISVSKMDKSNQAGMYGIPATMLMEYGMCGTKLALFYSKKAIELDPDNAYWHFLLGKMLGRCRRVEKRLEIPSNEEISEFRKAITLENNYMYLVFAAEVYAEFANRVYFNNRSQPGGLDKQTWNAVNEMNREASELFRKSYELRPEYVQVLFQAAKGLMKLPKPYKDVKLAKLMIEKGLEKAPKNLRGNHLMAQLCEHHLKDMDNAIRYLEICIQSKVFGAHMDMIRISYHHKKDFDIKALEDMLTVYNEPAYKAEILLQLVSYHIFIANDLIKACEYFRECMKFDFQRHLKNHQSHFLDIRQKIFLDDIIMDEIKFELENGCSEDKMSVYQTFLNDLTASSIEIPEGGVKHLKKKILKRNEELGLGLKEPKKNNHIFEKSKYFGKVDKEIRKPKESFNAWRQRMNRNTNQVDLRWQRNYRNNNPTEMHGRLNATTHYNKGLESLNIPRTSFEEFNLNENLKPRPKRDDHKKDRPKRDKGRNQYSGEASCNRSNNSLAKPSLEEQLQNLNIRPRKSDNS